MNPAAAAGRAAGPSVTSRVLSLLAAFDRDHAALTLTELSRRSGCSLTTTHRLAGELVPWGALERDDAGRYRIGRRLWDVGLLASVHRDLREVAVPTLQDVYAATHETVHLAVRQDGWALYVERVSGTRSVPAVSAVGARLPLHATGVGKVLLAHAPQAVQDDVLSRLERVTAHTVVHPGLLRRQLEAVRSNGFARTGEEMTLGICGVAVPVRDAGGDVVAALGVVFAASRRGTERIVPVLQVAASAITRALASATFR
ncbi:MAG TPA: IclR family transcriptional regulator [Actinomycetales bacterium]